MPDPVRAQYSYDVEIAVCHYWLVYKKGVLHLSEDSEYVGSCENYIQYFVESTKYLQKVELYLTFIL